MAGIRIRMRAGLECCLDYSTMVLSLRQPQQNELLLIMLHVKFREVVGRCQVSR